MAASRGGEHATPTRQLTEILGIDADSLYMYRFGKHALPDEMRCDAQMIGE